MKREIDFFPVGTTFAPLAKATEVPVEEWEGDVANMQRLGFNVFRLFIAWDRIERKRGEFDFTLPDHSFALAEKYGQRVIVNLGGSGTSLSGVYQPRWLHRECGGSLRKHRLDSPEVLRGNRMQVCYDDPALLENFERFAQVVVERYREHPALLAWSPWNEVGALTPCLCRHTLALYRRFLKEKYGDLPTLSAAWGSEFPVDFEAWEEVFPQEEAGFAEGGYQPFLDYREFLSRNRDEKFNFVKQCIEAADPSTPILVHLSNHLNADSGCSGDILGTSKYAYFERAKERHEFPLADLNRDWNYQMALFQLNSAPWRRDKDGFWIVEAEGGPTAWVHNMMPRTFSPEKMNARDMLFVSHGARAVMRWMYRSRMTDSQAGEFNLVGWDGSVTERAAAFGGLARFLTGHYDLFSRHEALPREVAMLHRDWEVYWRWQAEDVDRYWHSYRNLYGALAEVGVHCRVLSAKQLVEGGLDGVKLLIIPFRPWVSAEMAARLEAFVKNGGHLVADAPFAIKDMRAVHRLKTPGFGLDQVFGCRVFDMEKLFDDRCGELDGIDFKTIIRPEGCTVEAEFPDGKPAVASHRYGKGVARLYASQVFERFHNGNAERYHRELETLLAQAGVEPLYRLSGVTQEERSRLTIQLRRLPDGRRLLFAINLSDRAVNARLEIPSGETFHPFGTDSGESGLAGDCLRLAPFGWLTALILN